MNDAVIELSNVSFHCYEQQIIRSLSLTIRKGEFVVLVGPNGSGKSTLVKIINGMVKASSGEVRIAQQNIVGRPVYEIARLVSTLTQDLQHSTFSELSVLMNMELAQSRNRQASFDLPLGDYLASFNPSLKERLTVMAGHLSGGQRQALALAMCFAHKPLVLVLDEHTSALDPKAAESLMALTNERIAQENLTSVMITHSLEHALRYGNRLLVMNEGRIALDLSGEDKKALNKSELIALAY